MAKDNSLNIQTLIEGAKKAGAGRSAGLTDDQTVQLAELQAEFNQLEEARVELTDRRAAGEAIDTQALIQIRKRQTAIQKQQRRLEQRAARNFNRQRTLSPQDAAALEAAGIDPAALSAAQDAELRALGINPDRLRLGEYNDNNQQFPGERGGADRDAEFLRQAAQGFDGAEDANLFQNFGGMVDGENRVRNDVEAYYEELLNAQNERGLTPYDVRRQRRQGEALLPPDVDGLGLGAGRRPASLQEFVEFKIQPGDVPSPDGINGSPAHVAKVQEEREKLARRVENQYQLQYGSPDDRRLRNRQFDEDNLDRLGEEWKEQDFGRGMDVGDGVARQLIDNEGRSRRRAGLKRDENGNVVTVVGSDGKRRQVRQNRQYPRAAQAVGPITGGAEDAIRRIEAQLASGQLSLDTPVPVAEGRKPQTVGQLLADLKGELDGGIGLQRQKREARKAAAEADRRAAGLYTESEIREVRRRAANQILFGDADSALGNDPRPVVDQSGLRAGRSQSPVTNPRLLELQAQLDQVDGSTLIGKQKQERLLKEMRQIMVMGRVGGKNNPFFNQEQFEAPMRRGAVLRDNDLSMRLAVDSAVDDVIRAEAAGRAEVGPGRRRWVQAQNEFIARQLPEMMANEAIRVAGERRSRPLTPVEERQFRRNLQQEVLPGERVKGINVQPGQGNQKLERQLVRGEYVGSIPNFKAVIDAAPEVNRGTADPVIVDGQLLGYVDPVSGELLGETDPAKMMAFDDEQGRFVDPSAVRDGSPLKQARDWIDGALFDEYDERLMGDQVDANWPRNQQIVQPLDALGEAIGKKVKHPVVIRGVEDFNAAMAEYIGTKRSFDLPDPENPGQNIRVPASQVPQEQLFDAALKDLKVPQKPLARALNVLDQAEGNIRPGSMEVINADDKRAFREGSFEERVAMMRHNRRLANQQQAAIDNAQRDRDNFNAYFDTDYPLTTDEKLDVAAQVREQAGIRRLDRDADIQQIGGARLKQPQRNEQGIKIEDEGRLIAPILRELDPYQNIGLVVDDEISRIEAEQGVKVTPQQRQAIRQRIELDNGFADIDVWGPEARKPFIGAIGEGNRGGGLRKGPNDRQNVAAVNPNLEPAEVRREAVFPVRQRDADAAAARGNRVIPRPINRGAIQQQLELRDRLLAQQAEAQPELINRRGDIRRGMADDAALGIDNPGGVFERRLADAALGPIAAEAARRKPLKPEDLIRLERNEQARLRGESAPAPFSLPSGDFRALANQQLGDPRGMDRNLPQPQEVIEALNPAIRTDRAVVGPVFGSSQQATSQQSTGVPNTTSRSELLLPPARRTIIPTDFAGYSSLPQYDTAPVNQAPKRDVRPAQQPVVNIDWEATDPKDFVNNSPGKAPGADEQIKAQRQKREEPKVSQPSASATTNQKQERRRSEANGIFDRLGRHIKKRRSAYGIGAAGVAGLGAGALISGERDRRQEQEVA